VLFALPSFLILYFAYPSLDWLVREIFAWDFIPKTLGGSCQCWPGI
jgi:hypothetical protein